MWINGRKGFYEFSQIIDEQLKETRENGEPRWAQ
jgi:hypothetical protein